MIAAPWDRVGSPGFRTVWAKGQPALSTRGALGLRRQFRFSQVTLEVNMRAPVIASPSDLDAIPDVPAVFLLWASEGKPYLARTALLRRRLKRLISDRDRVSRLLNLRGIAERIEYWPMGSRLESSLLHLELAQTYFPEDWPRITRLRPPAFVRLTVDNPFPRTMVTTRLGRGLFYGPFASRAAAERFDGEMLDLFQIRRCEEEFSAVAGASGVHLRGDGEVPAALSGGGIDRGVSQRGGAGGAVFADERRVAAGNGGGGAGSGERGDAVRGGREAASESREDCRGEGAGRGAGAGCR